MNSNQNSKTKSLVVPPVSLPSTQPDGAATTADIKKQFVADTIAAYGPTIIRRLGSGRSEMNLATMSRLLASRLELAWDAPARQFLLPGPDQIFRPVALERVTLLVTETLQKIAAVHPDLFPMKDLRPARIKKLLDAIKVAAPFHRPDAQVVLRRFVEECLHLKPGGSVTFSELHRVFVAYADKHQSPGCPRSVFSREVARAVFKVFLKTPSNSVRRPVSGTNRLTARHGFKGLAFVLTL